MNRNVVPYFGTSGMLLLLSACLAQSYDAGVDGPDRVTVGHSAQASRVDPDADCTPGNACTCANGTVEPHEECDPLAPGWLDVCDQRCMRTVYERCEFSESCFGEHSLCASYDGLAGRTFCAEYCARDEDCVQLPGFRSACNLAWCVVLCSDGQCPNGMSCLSKQRILDRVGETEVDMVGVCVVDPS